MKKRIKKFFKEDFRWDYALLASVTAIATGAVFYHMWKNDDPIKSVFNTADPDGTTGVHIFMKNGADYYYMNNQK